MTPDHMPLTVIQSKSDPEWAGLVKRFWRTVGTYRICVVCGGEMWPPRTGQPRKYCSHDCHLEHRREAERARRAERRAA